MGLIFPSVAAKRAPGPRNEQSEGSETPDQGIDADVVRSSLPTTDMPVPAEAGGM